MSWELNRIGDLCRVKSGKRLPKGMSVQNEPTNRKYLRVTDLKSHVVDESDIKYITEDIFKLISKYTINRDDIYISIAGTIGKVGIIPDSINGISLTENCCKLTELNKSKISQLFLMYYLRSYEGQSKMQSKTGGASQPKLAITRLKDILVPTPPLQTQKRIADILSTYDDLIENNLKRIKLLEQAAQNIYKEWFVNLRFPGHENTSINEETGLPQGWAEKGVCEFNSFKQYKTKIKPFEGEKEFLATSNVNGIAIHERGNFFSYEKKPSRAQIHPPLNSVWFARMSKTYKVLFLTEKSNNDYIISSGFAGFKAEKKEHLPFLFCMINSSIFSELKDNYASGSTQVSINNKSLNSIKLIEPSHELIEKFGALTYDSLELIKHLFTTNQKLKAARDILLPRLMNRTIEV